MISATMQEMLLNQINHEFYSSYFYLAMSSWCEERGLRGFGHWLRIQAQEELSHAMIIYNYIHERDGKVVLMPIEGPKAEFDSLMAVFQAALDHERGVTASFNRIASRAREESDFATGNFVQFFIDEQVEEEASFRDLIDQLRLVGDVGHAIFMLDREFAARTFVMPAQLKL